MQHCFVLATAQIINQMMIYCLAPIMISQCFMTKKISTNTKLDLAVNMLSLLLMTCVCVMNRMKRKQDGDAGSKEDNDRQRVLPVLQAICCWVGWG